MLHYILSSLFYLFSVFSFFLLRSCPPSFFCCLFSYFSVLLWLPPFFFSPLFALLFFFSPFLFFPPLSLFFCSVDFLLLSIVVFSLSFSVFSVFLIFTIFLWLLALLALCFYFRLFFFSIYLCVL